MNTSTFVLRFLVFVAGAALIVWAACLFAQGAAPGAVVVMLLDGALIAGGIVFERRRYRPDLRGGANWQPTGEKFKDPGTGKLMQVVYDPASGERNYVEV